MKKNLLVVLLLAAGTVFGGVSVGISIGAPPAPRVVAIPASPGPDYTWVGGYWYPVSGRYVWHDGYWSRPPYAGAHWVGPSHDGKLFHEGYWDGAHGRMKHDHASDREHDRDFHR
jgi:hypothetical protein